jgi:hypothetical protein
METYTVIVWCMDCYQEDFNGCFDGGIQRVVEDGQLKQPTITSAKRAHEIGELYRDECSRWDYEVEDSNGQLVDENGKVVNRDDAN